MPSWQRVKPLAAAGAVLVAGVTWALAFRSGWSNGDWSGQWVTPNEIRGKGVYIGNKNVETPIEKEKRLAVGGKELREDIGKLRKSVMGDRKKTRGDDIVPETPPLPDGFEYNPREACMEMKLEYPERFGNVDCMSDKYDNPDPWWKVGNRGQ